ncbi:hypothetical protein FLLO111716_05105 [Flavobacterium longum]|uniref:energy transducer TonB n=1 Tax=Flavobacterium longum TaxID=1299340 RepID=UPI0039ED205F
MKIAFVYAIALLTLTASAQHKIAKPKPIVCPEVRTDVVLAQFPGGKDSLKAFVNRNFTLPESYKKTKPFFIKSLVVRYTIEPDGRLSHIDALKNEFPDLAAEAIRVFKLSPKWTPGKKDGRTVAQPGGYVICINTAKPEILDCE